jgi:hypothetical protein
MKKLLLSLVLALTVLSPLSAIGVNTAKAGAYLTTNSAIRGTSVDTVYWYATDGKRYVFPNAQSFYSWFPNFNNVSVITDAELYAITIGGNVTFRPGAKLVKVNTDPRVYAVSRGGVLRHVTSEYLASQLYGSDWNTKVADVADVYFTNYTVGTPIYNVYDYNVSNEYNGVTTPSDSLREISGTITIGDQITLLASRTNITPGEAVTLSVANTNNYGSGYRAEIYDTRTNGLIRTCEAPFSYSVNDIFRTVSCSTTVYPQRNSTENSVQYYAVIRNSASTVIKNAYSPVIYFGTTNGTQFSSGSSSLEASRTTANVGETVTLTARATNLNTVESNIRTELYRESDNSLVDTCYDRATCTFNVTVTNDGTNAVRYYVIVKNDANEQIPTAYSSRITVSGTSTGTMVLTASRTTVASGETITLSATGASAWNTSRIVLVNEQNGAIIANCYSVSTCSQNVTVTGYNGETIRYRAEARDWSGAILATAYVTVYVSNTTTQTGTLTLTADRTSITSGQAVLLTANTHFTGANWSVPGNIGIDIRDASGVVVKNCSGMIRYCLVTVYPTQSNNAASTQYSASLSGNFSGATLTIYFNGTSNDNTNYINGLVLNTDRTTINSGELVHLTANAFNSGTWSYIGNRIEISSVNTGQILRTCYDVATCTLDVYPQAQSASNLTAQYQTRIYDRTGTLAMSQYSPVIYLNGATVNTNPNSGSMTGTGSVTFGPTENLRTNRMMYLTTTFLNSNLAVADAKVELYVENLSTPLATCLGSYTCAVSYATGATPVSTRVYARLSNRNNASQWLETPRVALTTTW